MSGGNSDCSLILAYSCYEVLVVCTTADRTAEDIASYTYNMRAAWVVKIKASNGDRTCFEAEAANRLTSQVLYNKSIYDRDRVDNYDYESTCSEQSTVATLISDSWRFSGHFSALF